MVAKQAKKKAGTTKRRPSGGITAHQSSTASRKAAKPQRKPRITKTSHEFRALLGDIDLHLFGEGKHLRIYEKLGAHLITHEGVSGVAFAVWAPNAERVSVVGNFNAWDGRRNLMRPLGSSGVWELFISGLQSGELYKYEIKPRHGPTFLKADPYGFMMEVPPDTSSIIFESRYKFRDRAWLNKRAKRQPWREPLSIYEVHFGSWRRIPEEDNRPLTYREMAPLLADYARENGFTHVEFLPLKEHPYGPSWGYQVGAYYAPSSRYGTPDDFRFLVDHLHRAGIGVIMDWVPAHFPKDAFALGRFDGTALYEHADPRKGEHPDWGTYIFNYARNEVRNFLIGNALFWLREFHLDGLRVDAVASMLYLDYSRKEREWVPNQFGGRENLEAISFLKELNEITHQECPGTLMIAEESTAWPQVSHPVYVGGLGFDFKWNMGWMHDTLKYFQTDPLFRAGNHNALTFGLLYAWSENFILAFSHDEVVHMKGALINKMPGNDWQKFANLRALYGYMWAHPGKKLLFMGGEFGQWREWTETESLDWHLLEKRRPQLNESTASSPLSAARRGVRGEVGATLNPTFSPSPLVGRENSNHRGVAALIKDLNKLYQKHSALWEADSDPNGFQWIEVDNALENTIAFRRISPSTGKELICVCNFSPIVREQHRLGLQRPGRYKQILNTDNEKFCGGGFGTVKSITAEKIPWQGLDYSAEITLPPLATMWFEGPTRWQSTAA
jgi:1,4-alpha-glucan branching enzyme